jgi:hypothetical protein
VHQTASRSIEADWHNKSGDELATSLTAVFTMVRDENEWRTDADEYHWGLYEGSGMGGVTVRSRKNMTYANATLPDNVCKMATDTLTAKVATIRPIPQVLASRGNWKDQRRARKSRQLIEGEFYRHQIHEKVSHRIIKDALVARAGIVKVFVNGRKPKVERVHSWTCFADDWDAEFGEPLNFFQLITMDRGKAIAKFGKNAKLRDRLKEAARFTSSTQVVRDEDRSATVDRIELLEAWHRCMDHDDDDPDHECTGKHAIICNGAVLFEEDWEHDWFPFAVLTYDTPNTGYWGSGLVQSLEGYQVPINEANSKLDEMYALSGKYVINRNGGGILNSDIVNGLRILNMKPGPYDPSIFDCDLVNEHMRMRPPELIERALNASGISQMAAQSQKPAGIESGIALQTLDDVETQRHIVFGRRFESWCMDVARLLIECIKQIAEKHGDYAVKVPMRGAYLDLKWSEVKIDGFQLQMQSVGQLYMSFAGRLEKLKTLFEMGAIDRGTFMRHMDAGDVQAELDMETADKLLVDEMLESMLDAEQSANDNADEGIDPNYKAPHGYLPLAWAHRRAHQKRLMAETDGAPVYVLDLLTRFIDDVKLLMDREQAELAAKNAPPPAPIAPPPPGGGQPMPMDPMAPPMGITPAGDAPMMPPDMGAPPMAA